MRWRWGVMVAPHGRVAAPARPAVDDQDRLAVGVAAFLKEDLVPAPTLSRSWR